uniref:Uncharacterized protein n=1 Tax=Physcomitrium patens TaxID=3218 RepID=A0A2K1KG13_PHYPA|nr:hypothetical protein PHYPA_009074 [Physcomitrium patens]
MGREVNCCCSVVVVVVVVSCETDHQLHYQVTQSINLVYSSGDDDDDDDDDAASSPSMQNAVAVNLN